MWRQPSNRLDGIDRTAAEVGTEAKGKEGQRGKGQEAKAKAKAKGKRQKEGALRELYLVKRRRKCRALVGYDCG